MTEHIWTPAALAAALGVPEEAFRAFVSLRGVFWTSRLTPCLASELTVAWVAADRASGSGPLAEAAGALLDAMASPPAG